MKIRWVCMAGIITVVSLPGAATARPGSAAPQQGDNSIIVKRAAGVTSGVAWDVTLPPSRLGHIQDQAWLVVDGKSEGLGGDDIPPAEFLKGSPKTVRLYANINDDLDGQVKDILKAQGLPVKADVTTYRMHYGAASPVEGPNGPITLHFRNSSGALVFWNDWTPQTATYKVGERITLFDAVALDSEEVLEKPFDMNDPKHGIKPGVPTDMAHHILIQVQFLPVGPGGKMITSTASK